MSQCRRGHQSFNQERERRDSVGKTYKPVHAFWEGGRSGIISYHIRDIYAQVIFSYILCLCDMVFENVLCPTPKVFPFPAFYSNSNQHSLSFCFPPENVLQSLAKDTVIRTGLCSSRNIIPVLKGKPVPCDRYTRSTNAQEAMAGPHPYPGGPHRLKPARRVRERGSQ